MKLVVGLGNPGGQYNFTRHNVGFLTLDFLLKKIGVEWAARQKFNAIYAKVSAKEAPMVFPKQKEDIIFIKPQGYYNESGRVVADFMRYYKIPLANLLVVCDDFNLEFGKVRYRVSGSAGGNNGLKSIIVSLGTDEFARIRIGTGNDELRKKMGDMEFVLSKFTAEEKAKLSEIISETSERINTEFF